MQKEIEEAAFYCREAYRRGLVGGTGGNASVRLGDTVYITPTGSRLGDIKPEALMPVSMDGTWEPSGAGARPSKELDLHLSIYRKRADALAVLHLHPANCIAALLMQDNIEEEIPAYTPGYFCKVMRLSAVGFFAPGSPELAQSVGEKIVHTSTLLMKNHGVIVSAKTMEQAFNQIEDIEENAKLHLLLRGTGALGGQEQAILCKAFHF